MGGTKAVDGWAGDEGRVGDEGGMGEQTLVLEQGEERGGRGRSKCCQGGVGGVN